jgi:hypothetical protein
MRGNDAVRPIITETCALKKINAAVLVVWAERGFAEPLVHGSLEVPRVILSRP